VLPFSDDRLILFWQWPFLGFKVQPFWLFSSLIAYAYELCRHGSLLGHFFDQILPIPFDRYVE